MLYVASSISQEYLNTKPFSDGVIYTLSLISADAHSLLLASDRTTGYFVGRTSFSRGPPANTGFARHVPEPYRYAELLPFVLTRILSARSLGTQTLAKDARAKIEEDSSAIQFYYIS
jgi:hypothetical protein